MRRVPAQALKALSARSDARGLAQLSGHFAAVAAGAALVLAVYGSLWLWPAMAVLGILEVALFAPLHETTHRTPFRSLWLNRVAGWVTGFVLLLPPEGFRLFHLAHHRHTQDPVHDPELIGAKPLTRWRYFWILTGLPYWGAQTGTLLRTAAGDASAPWIPRASRPAVVREARIYLALYGVLAIGALVAWSPLPLLLWVGPTLLGQPVLRFVLLAEHKGCALGDDRLANTRTTLAGRAFALLFWNANLHVEHHLAPGVPFHALPALHRVIRPQIKVLDPNYAAAHRNILAGLG